MSEVNRLAMGFVREELRRIRTITGKTEEATQEKIIKLYELMRDRTQPYFSRGKRLPEGADRRIKRELREFIDKNFVLVSEVEQKIRISGRENVVSRADGFYYIQPLKHRLMRNSDGTEFDEEGVEFRFFRICITRRWAIIDDMSCNLGVAWHALQRLIERHACSSQPILYLTKRLFSYLPLVPLYTLVAGTINDDAGIMIPLDNGILMGCLISSEDEVSINFHNRKRFTSDHMGSGLEKLPAHNPYMVGSTLLTIRASTYLDDGLLTSEQRWGKAAIQGLLATHRDVSFHHVNMLTAPESMSYSGISPLITPLFSDFKAIFRDPRWKIANRL